MTDYGSGVIGSWSGSSRVISPPSIIGQVLAGDGLYMAGDSISVATAHELAEMLLPSGNLLAVHNWSGRPTAPAVDAIIEWLDTYGGPRRILMATGNNDIFEPPAMAGQIDRLMTAAGSGRTVFWVSIQCSRWSYPAATQVADQRNSGWVNAQLYDATKRWPNLIIIPWHRWLAEKPFRLTQYLTDGVHVILPTGAAFRNTILRDAILAEQAGP
jgi:hypothetical protein